MFGAKLFHPERYHGHRRRPPFFEGWYFKLVDRHEDRRHAVIPGIFLSDDPDEHHAFVQILDGSTGQASYHRFPASEFQAAGDRFDVAIGPNRFWDGGLQLDLDGVAGEVRMHGLNPWPVRPWSLGIMGPYGWVPRMECNHGVVSLDHRLAGSLVFGDAEVSYDGGRGYIEKDWGKSFPAGYVWMQSNHFPTASTSMVASIAIIPWLFSAFPGFIIGLWHQGELRRFATYTGARTEHLEITDDHVDWVVADRRSRLSLLARRSEGGLLYGPTRERMGDRVGETMRSTIDLRLEQGGVTALDATGSSAGLEIHGDLDRLLALQR